MSHLVYIFQIGIIRGKPEKFFFGDHVRNENLGKITKFGYHTITGVDMPEPNVVLRVTLTPPSLSTMTTLTSA